MDLFGGKTIRKEASGGVIRHLKDVGKNVYADMGVEMPLYYGWIVIGKERISVLKSYLV